MKFLCDNCKAKYQIADEKVAGKTVRMKCRKCGHQIEVRSAVTEGSGSVPPPAPLPGVRPPPRTGLATSLSAQKPKGAAPSALAGAFTKNVEEAPVSSVGRSEGSIDLSVSDEWYVAINGVPVGPIRISELRRKAATGACNEESLCWQEGLEEWRPIRSIPELATLVREAAAGNRPSLSGEPAASPAPGRTSNMPPPPKAEPKRSSTVPPAPLQPSAPRQVVASTPARSNVLPFRPSTPSMEDVGLAPFGGGSAAPSLNPFPGSAPMQVAPAAMATSPLPLSSPMMPAAPPQTTPMAPPMGSPDPFAMPPPNGYPSASMPSASPYSHPPAVSHPSYPDRGSMMPAFAPPQQMAPPSAVPEPKRGGAPLWFWPILVLFLGFGGGGAYFLFGRPQTPPAPVVIQVQPTATAQAPAPSDTVATIEMPDPPTIEPQPTGGGGGTPKKPTGKQPVAAAAPKTEPKGGIDLGGLGGTAGGPSVGPSGGGGGGGSGGGLDTAGVERVVSAHRAGVKRTCWERGGADQKSSVNVTVTAQVAPNGTVTSTSHSGDDPVVGKCIENQVKSWSFPAPGSPTTLNIPFKFVRQ